MRTLVSVGALFFTLAGCADTSGDGAVERKALAERFFRGVYGCDPSVVDDLAAADIVISYPIFQTIFGRPALQGPEAAKRLIENFCRTWADPQLTVHDAIAEGDNVSLLWSFEARNVGALPGGQPATNRVHGWGGITFFRFDSDGRIAAEIGEESEPGPVSRARASGARF